MGGVADPDLAEILPDDIKNVDKARIFVGEEWLFWRGLLPRSKSVPIGVHSASPSSIENARLRGTIRRREPRLS